jgi:chemotaxis response regulator CheB
MSLIRVLIGDDVEFWRPVYSMLEADRSFEIVFEASNGLKAVEAAEKLQPTVVLLDIGR